jgi:hypothetical protein
MGLDAGSFRPKSVFEGRCTVCTRIHLFRRLLISPRMSSPQPLTTLWDRFKRSLAQQLIVNRPPAHADLAMDTPDRGLDLLCIKRSLSGKYMLLDAFDQRVIEVEQKRTVRCAL